MATVIIWSDFGAQENKVCHYFHCFPICHEVMWPDAMIFIYDKSRQLIKKQRHYFANKGLYSQNYVFSSSHVWIWELDHKEDWALKNWCFWTMVLEKNLESPLDCKIKPVTIPLLGTHTEETRIETDMCTPMFIAALFIIARTWKQPRCPSAEWTRKLWYIYTMEYYSSIKKNTF